MEFFDLFLINATLLIIVSKYLLKQLNVLEKLLIISPFVIAPIYVHIPSGINGIVLFLDLVCPLLIAADTKRKKIPLSCLFPKQYALLLVFFPLLFSMVGYIVQPQEYPSTYLLLLSTVAYRGAVAVAYIGWFIHVVQRNGLQAIILRAYIYIWLSLSMLAIAQYLSLLDLNIFDVVIAKSQDVSLTEQLVSRLELQGTFLILPRGYSSLFFIVGYFLVLYSSFRIKNINFAFIVLSALIFAIALLFTGSRIGVLAVVLTTIAMGVLSLKNFSTIMTIVAFSVVSMLYLNFDDEIYAKMERFTVLFDNSDFTSDYAANLRYEGWVSILAYLYNNPFQLLFGIGGLNPDKTLLIANMYSAHNQYLDLLLRYGILGGVPFLLITWKTIFRYSINTHSRYKNDSLKNYNIKNSLQRRIVFIFISILLLLSVTQETLQFYTAPGYLGVLWIWLVVQILK